MHLLVPPVANDKVSKGSSYLYVYAYRNWLVISTSTLLFIGKRIVTDYFLCQYGSTLSMTTDCFCLIPPGGNVGRTNVMCASQRLAKLIEDERCSSCCSGDERAKTSYLDNGGITSMT